VDHLLRFLKTIGKNDVFDVCQKDIENYLNVYAAKGKRQSAINNLADIKPFFANLWARGLVDGTPFQTVFAKRTTVDDDFVPPEQMAILLDISKVNLKDMIEVRDRLLAVCLCYDFALRLGEAARLKVSDVKVNDYVELTIRSEIQKGSGKADKLDYSYFQESKILMTAYLKLRNEKNPSTDALIITEKGERLFEDGCRDAIKTLCKRLRVTTFKGSVPAPHRFRHSFGTCNVTPLGLGLDVYDIMKRLRHTSVELTTRTYISDNPLLTKAKHDAHVQNARAARANATANQTGAVRVLPQPLNRMVRPQALSHGSCPAPSTIDKNGRDFCVTERDAVRLLAPLGIVCMALRKYADAQGKAEKIKGEYFYSRQFIEDLCNTFFSKQEAMRIIGFAKSAFFYWVQSRGIEQVVIGKVSLVRKDDVLAKSRNGDLKRSA
jgi:site-specific recombinase XerD